jgi:hypothetical protein
VGVAEEELALVGRLISWRWRAWLQPASLSAGHGFSGLNNIRSGDASLFGTPNSVAVFRRDPTIHILENLMKARLRRNSDIARGDAMGLWAGYLSMPGRYYIPAEQPIHRSYQ